MRRTAATVLALLAACTKIPAEASIAKDWTGKSPGEIRALLNRVADECGLRHDFFKIEAGKLLIQPGMNSKYESVSCGITSANSVRGLPPIWFVGNEAPAEESR